MIKRKCSDLFIDSYIKNRGSSDYSYTAEMLDEPYLEQVYGEVLADYVNKPEYITNKLSGEDKSVILAELVKSINPHVSIQAYERIRSTTKTEEQSFRVIDEFGPTAYFFLPKDQQQNGNLILHYLECAKGLQNHDSEEFSSYNKIPSEIFNDLNFLEKAVKVDFGFLQASPRDSKGYDLIKNSKDNDPMKVLEAMRMAEDLQKNLVKNEPMAKQTKKIKL